MDENNNIDVETSDKDEKVLHCPIKNADCIGENCAWYDRAYSYCSVISCADSLNQIFKIVNSRMPLDRW